ncbi:MAG TPA: HAD hydrolase family protein [Ruminococcus sp.]|nr:HAD hydrolase family protein [Ruminococcus sp.]
MEGYYGSYFFDIDGTLVTEDERGLIPESTRTAVAETRKRGNLTFINSGRTAFNISPRVKELGFDGYLLGCGTYIEYQGNVILSNNLEKSFCNNIAQKMRECCITPVYEHRDGYFFDDKCPVSDGLKHFMETFVDSGIDISRRVEDKEFIFDKFVVWCSKDTDMERFRREVSPYFDIIDRGGRILRECAEGILKGYCNRRNTQEAGDTCQ